MFLDVDGEGIQLQRNILEEIDILNFVVLGEEHIDEMLFWSVLLFIDNVEFVPGRSKYDWIVDKELGVVINVDVLETKLCGGYFAVADVGELYVLQGEV